MVETTLAARKEASDHIELFRNYVANLVSVIEETNLLQGDPEAQSDGAPQVESEAQDGVTNGDATNGSRDLVNIVVRISNNLSQLFGLPS